jgi:hypothetical protein
VTEAACTPRWNPRVIPYPGTTSTARAALTQAAAFLAWLAERDRAIGECSQADLDAWYAEDVTSRRLAQGFLRWCTTNQAMPHVKIPVIRTENLTPISQHRCIALIRKLITNDSLPPMERVAAALVLLYAQPIRRLIRLTVHDVLHIGDHGLGEETTRIEC